MLLMDKEIWYDKGVKRIFDFTFSLLFLIILSPVMLFIMLLLMILQPGSPIFCQERVGRRRRIFRILKFRTMTQARATESGELLPDDARTTWIGSVLRATSLDELPELINILKGDMSFIGPRPWVPEQMANFSERIQTKRMSVRPGLSGLAQILGRNNLTFRQRVCIDLRYIRHRGFWMDAWIFLATFYKVMKREGIYQLPSAYSHPPKDPHTRGCRANRTHREYK